MGLYNRATSAKAKRDLLLGTVCCNCGKDCGVEIEYHHIVPLEHGGGDHSGNLAPLCPECHSLCTWGFIHKKAERTGRKRKEYDSGLLDSVFTAYVNKEISETDAREKLGTGCRVKDMIQFKEWAERNGIDARQRFGRAGRWYKRA